jgi:hypothetical protein
MGARQLNLRSSGQTESSGLAMDARRDAMTGLLLWVGRLAGLVGVALAALSVVFRLTGSWHVGSYAVGTLLMGGIAAMVLGTLAYAAVAAERHHLGGGADPQNLLPEASLTD